MDPSSTAYALLATQNALLDVVTPDLRAVVVKADQAKNIFYIHFYYHGIPSEDQIEEWNCAITEATADLTLATDEGIERVDYPKPIPIHGTFAYLRKEPYIPPSEIPLKSNFIDQRELVNFEEIIGRFLKPGNLEEFPTSWGVIHYGENGCHIIPAKPKELILGKYLKAYAQLALQRALLGRIVPELRVVITDVLEGSNHVFIRLFYAKPVSIDVMEEWECALSETIADFGEGYTFDIGIEEIPYPQVPPVRGTYVYSRKEHGLF